MIEVHIYGDGSVSVTRNGNPFNKWDLKYWEESKTIEIPEPIGI